MKDNNAESKYETSELASYEQGRNNRKYNALACATEHPTNLHPFRTVFNQRSFESLIRAGARLDVISPTPFAPPVGPYSEYRYVPKVERWGSYPIHHPRFFYLLPKRFLYHVSGDSFAKRTSAYVNRTFEVPDVVHAANVYLDGYGLLPYCQEHDLPLFVTSHGGTLGNYDDLSQKARSRIRETLDYSEKVLCVSGPLADRAKKLTDRSKVIVFPIGADPENFPLDRREQLRREMDIDPSLPVVLFVGRYVKDKGTDELAAAMESIDSHEIQLVCIGQRGGERWTLIDRLGNTEHATTVFEGMPPLAVRRWFAVADLLVLPSHQEGRPTVIYEAMASKTCVLATTVGGIPEQVVDGGTGALVPPGDVEAFAQKLDELTANLGRTHRMGVRGYERLLEKGWTWNRYGERLAEFHRESIE